MAAPRAENRTTPDHARRLRELIATQTLVLPGAFNTLTALQIERAGFSALYISGAGMTAARGLPDIGLLSLPDVLSDAGAIAGAVTIPALVDADTGFGSPPAVRKCVQVFEAAGMAGIQLEDQELPKKCGHLPGKRLVSTQEMIGKIRAAQDGRKNPHFFIVARTDARSVEGLESALQRARDYVEAGADAIFPEALESADEFRLFAKRLARAGLEIPLVANMTEFGKTPYMSVREFEDLGYRLVLFPVSALRVAARAVEEFLRDLHELGTQQGWLGRMQTRQELYDLLRYEHYERPTRKESTGNVAHNP